MAYNLNPQPQAGSGIYGSVPGSLSLPNPAGDLGANIPGLSTLNKTASSDILSNLEGKLSPATENALQNASATYGAASGMPGSGLSWNSLYGNIAGASTAEQQLGLQELNPFVSNTSGTQTVAPGLQTQIAGTNASNAASPNPGQSASYAEQLFNQYLNQMRGPGAGGSVSGNPAGDSLTGLPTWSGGASADPYSTYDVGAFPYQGDFSGAGTDASAYAGA